MGFLKHPAPAGETSSNADLSAVIARLKKEGGDPAVPHVTRHFMYIPGVKAAQHVAREVKAPGRSVEIETSARRGFWLVVVSQSMLLTQDGVSSVRTEFESVARSAGGEYDRWQVDLAGG